MKRRRRCRHKNSSKGTTRGEGTETGWNQDIKAYKSLYFKVQKIPSPKIWSFPGNDHTVKKFSFWSKKGGCAQGHFSNLVLETSFLLCLIQASAIASHTWAHKQKSLKKIEVGFTWDSKTRASFACRWPSLESHWLSARQHGCAILSYCERAENGWLPDLLQFLKPVFRDWDYFGRPGFRICFQKVLDISKWLLLLWYFLQRWQRLKENQS